MKQGLLYLLIILITFTVIGCAPNYSNGERIGVVTKLAQKGIIWKSWEGILMPVSDSGIMVNDPFPFNVDPSCLVKIQSAAKSGKRVTIIYHQYLIAPPNIESSHIVIDVKE